MTNILICSSDCVDETVKKKFSQYHVQSLATSLHIRNIQLLNVKITPPKKKNLKYIENNYLSSRIIDIFAKQIFQLINHLKKKRILILT